MDQDVVRWTEMRGETWGDVHATFDARGDDRDILLRCWEGPSKAVAKPARQAREEPAKPVKKK
jgi:hypothetical protein